MAAAASAASETAATTAEAKAKSLVSKEAGNEHHKAGRYGDAIDAYSTAIALDPSSAPLYSNRAASRMMVDQYAEAIQDCNKAIDLSKGFMKAYVRGATARLRIGDVEGALEMLTRAHLQDPRYDAIHGQRKIATKTLQHLERAREAVSDGRWDAAMKELADVRREVKKSMEVDILEAQALIGQGKPEEALALATDVMRTPEGRRSSTVLTTRAHCLYLQGNLTHAERHLSQVLKMDPDHKAAGALLKIIRRLEECKGRGNDAFRGGDNARAVTEYTACINLAPDSKPFLATVFANRAAARMKLGAWDLASADCDNCLELNDQYIKGYLRRAECAQKIGGKEALERALRDLNAAKDLSPDTATLRNIERDIPRVRQLIKIASTKDFYKVLGVTRASSAAEIKKAYRTLTLRNHPDKLAHKGEQERKIAEAKIKELNEAYDVLSDPAKKSRYDAGVDPDHLDDEHHHGGMRGGGGGMRGGGGMDVPPEVLAAMFGAMGGGMGGFGMGGGARRGGHRGGAGGMHFGFG